jgi:tetratricopeptide (TPR) repeat protein
VGRASSRAGFLSPAGRGVLLLSGALKRPAIFGPTPDSPRPKRVLSSRQRWTFRFIAVLIPLLLLAMAEVFLRMSGYGYPTNFFLKQRINGREVLTDNRQFGWRFFPRHLARTPQPVMFSPHKAPGTTRIFIFGESAAMGDPEPAFGLPRMLQAMLELKFPSNKFEVINVAMTAINSHVIHEIAKDCAPLEGDVWLIYMGNNEVVGPFGGGTIFGPQVPSLAFVRSSLWLKQFRIVQLLSSFVQRGPKEWSGMEMFLEQQMGHDDPRLTKVNECFRQNLNDIVRVGSDAGAKVIVSTIAVNLRDCPPFASQHRAVARKEAPGFERPFALGLEFVESNRFAEAQAAFSRATRRTGEHGEDEFAELFYQLARRELTLGSNHVAFTNFHLAREFDRLRFRADGKINGSLRAHAFMKHARERFVDAEHTLAAASSNGIPGSEFFFDHVHFTFDGTYELARAFFHEVVKTLPSSVVMHGGASVPTIDDCARRLAWTDWERLQVFEEMCQRMQRPPFTAQSGHAARDAELKRRIDELSANLTPEKVQHLADDYTAAVRLKPTDWILREKFARFLETHGETARALEQWREVMRLLPHDPEAHERTGHLLDALGASAEAAPFFLQVLRRLPDSADAHFNYGVSLAKLGKFADAAREFSLTLKLSPEHPRAREMLEQAKKMK